MLALSQDDDLSISEFCDNAIRTSLQKSVFVNIVEQTFITHIIRLPRIISVGDEEEQVAGMLLLKGLLAALSHANTKMIFTVQDTLERFVAVLISAVELKRNVSLLLEEFTLRNFDEIDELACTTLPWKQFKNMRSPTIVNHFQSICKIIGTSNASDMVVGYLLQQWPENVTTCNEIIVLLQFLLTSNDHRTSISNCLDEFLLDIHWHLAVQANKTTKMEREEVRTEGSTEESTPWSFIYLFLLFAIQINTDWYEDRTEGLYESAISIRYTDVRWKGDENVKHSDDEITISDAMCNVLHTCLVLETVGHFATILRNDFQPFLFRTLHKVLEKSGK